MMPETSQPDRLLNGRVTLHQPFTGYRAAIDPVLLAAACPAGAGETVLDAGCGVGAAALCLMARVECRVTGIEIQPAMAELATRNARENGWNERFEVINASIPIMAKVKQARFDHVICNPPYLPEGYGAGKPSPANHEGEAKLADWITFATRRVKEGGSVVFIHRADRLDELLPLMSARLGALVVFPLWPHAGETAKRVIVGGIKGRKTPMRLAAGMVLHNAEGGYTGEANAVLRDAQSIVLWPR